MKTDRGSKATFSIIIPTIGRETLRRTLDSLVAAGADRRDEVIVVGDGRQLVAESIVKRFTGVPTLYVQGAETRAYGGSQRNFGMSLAMKENLIFIDDDDERVSDSITWARQAVDENPGKILLFKEEERREHPSWRRVWREKKVELGNVGTQMIVVPNARGYLGRWPDKCCSDYGFIRSTVDLWPGGEEGVVWIDRVVAYLY